MTTHFGLIRHARTLWNVEKRIQGHKDSLLTPDGSRQAKTWGQQLKQFGWNRILSSDTGRALKTAELVNETLQVPASSDSRFREQNWGAWTGQTENELRRDFSKTLRKQMAKGWEFRPPGGESRWQVWTRTFNALKESAKRWPDATILILTHEGVIKALTYRLHGREFLPDEPPLIEPYHLHWLVFNSSENRLEIERINALALL